MKRKRVQTTACGICHEGFDDEKLCPRLLSCGHSYCGNCLENLIQAASVVTCPNCQKEAPVPGGVSGLPKNFALLDALLAAPKEDFAARICNVCSDEHNAQFACLDCKQNFCQQASLWHKRFKLTLKHRVASFEELKANPQLLQTSNTCFEHDKAFRFFDEDCGRVICRDCVALKHKGHNCSSLASAAAKCREEIGAKVEQVVTRAQQVEAAETRAAEVSQSLNENFTRESSKIRASFQEIHDAATAREALLVQELTQHHKAKSMTLSNQCDLLHTSRVCLESVVQRTQTAIKSQDDVQLLVARSDLISTLALVDQPIAPEADDLLRFSVAPAELLEMLKEVGEVSDETSTCAATTTAEALTWRVEPGEEFSFKIIACDDTGQQRDVGGDTFEVRLHVDEPPLSIFEEDDGEGDEGEEGLDVKVDDKGDGTYEVTFVFPAEATGYQKMSVSVHGSEIQGSPFLLGAGLFERRNHDGLEVNEDCTVVKSNTQHYSSVFGWERVTEGRWKFHIDQKPVGSRLMFGVVDASKPSPSHKSAGSYGVGPTWTYSNGVSTKEATQFLEGEDVIVELDDSGLTVTNAAGKATKVAVPAGPEYKLHLCLYRQTQVTWIEELKLLA